MAADRVVARLSGLAVPHRLRGGQEQAPPAQGPAPALQPVARRLLHLLDLLRHSGPGQRIPLVACAHLSWPHAGVPVRLAAAGPPHPGGQARTHHLHRRLHRRPLWQVPAPGHGDQPDRRHGDTSLPGAAAQGHSHRAGSADGQLGAGGAHGQHGRAGPRRRPVAGAVQHTVRHPQPGCHRTPSRHGGGHRLRVRGQAARLHGGGGLRALAHHRQAERGPHPGGHRLSRCGGGGVAGQPAGARHLYPGGHVRRHLPAAPVPRDCGGEQPGPGSSLGALVVPALPVPDGALHLAAGTGGQAVGRGRHGLGHLCDKPAHVAGLRRHGDAGVSRRYLGGHRHGDRLHHSPGHHGQQRSGAAGAAAPLLAAGAG